MDYKTPAVVVVVKSSGVERTMIQLFFTRLKKKREREKKRNHESTKDIKKNI